MVLRRQKHDLSQSTTPFACTLPVLDQGGLENIETLFLLPPWPCNFLAPLQESFGPFGPKSRQLGDRYWHTSSAEKWLLFLRGPFGPRVSYGVSPRVSPKTGVSKGVSHRVSLEPFGRRLRSVQKVSRECPKGVPDTLGTLSGYFLDTAESGARRGPSDTPCDTLLDTPVSAYTLGDTP